jgi:hypothetical protein
MVLQCILLRLIYDVEKREKNEENTEKKLFIALTGCISFERKTKKISVTCAMF